MSTTITLFATAALAATLCAQALAQSGARRLGDHPAVVVQRLQAKQGYDYASKFYPHPAWLYLHLVPPGTEVAEHGPIAPLVQPVADRSAGALARADVE